MLMFLVEIPKSKLVQLTTHTEVLMVVIGNPKIGARHVFMITIAPGVRNTKVSLKSIKPLIAHIKVISNQCLQNPQVGRLCLIMKML